MSPSGRSKGDESRDRLHAAQLARRLVQNETSGGENGRSPANAAIAACNTLCRGLARWVGPDGRDALFARALADAQADYPLLDRIRLGNGPTPQLDGAAEAIESYGDAATANAMRSMLVALIELLSRLVGYDLVTRLVEAGELSSGDDVTPRSIPLREPQ